jgi:ATP-dependent DNA ligase
MAPMPDRARPAPPLDPVEWRPMVPLATRKPPEIRDAVLEPLWTGTRVVAHVSRTEPRVRLLDVFGVDLAPEIGGLAALVADAVDADEAIIDGILTDQATRGGIGASTITQPRVSLASVMFHHDPGVEIVRPADTAADGAGPVEAFVALDLLRLDGEALLDVPLLERKRLLESVVGESERVRVSVLVRPPVDAWVATWQAAGLRGAMLKAANSRYVPGGRTIEWRTVTRVAARR